MKAIIKYRDKGRTDDEFESEELSISYTDKCVKIYKDGYRGYTIAIVPLDVIEVVCVEDERTD